VDKKLDGKVRKDIKKCKINNQQAIINIYGAKAEYS
jgi:hypothetical protein